MAWVFFLQRRDEQRHAALFDRIGAEVLAFRATTRPSAGSPPANTSRPPSSSSSRSGSRRSPRRSPPGADGLLEGVSLYHMLLEGVVFDAGQHAGARRARGRRTAGGAGGHRASRARRALAVGFGLRCLIETEPTQRAARRAPAAGERGGDGLGRRGPTATCEHERAQGRAPAARRSAHRVARAGVGGAGAWSCCGAVKGAGEVVVGPAAAAGLVGAGQRNECSVIADIRRSCMQTT